MGEILDHLRELVETVRAKEEEKVLLESCTFYSDINIL